MAGAMPPPGARLRAWIGSVNHAQSMMPMPWDTT